MTAKKIGVALSGGGYRAAVFHVGTLRALHNIGLLTRVDVISTISGGSITGAAYCLHKGEFPFFDAFMLNAISTKSVIRYIFKSWLFWRFILFLFAFLVPAIWLLFYQYSWVSLIILFILGVLLVACQFRFFPVSRVIEQAYSDFYFHTAKLSDLPSKPELAIGATNLQTCRPFTFSPRKMEDSSYAYHTPSIRFKHADFPVSRAVVASTCVPFAFTPVTIGPEFFANPEDQQRCRPILVDGGVYDNQGVHKITQPGSSYECRYIITSDAGNRLPFEKSYNNTYTLLVRTVDVFMNRIKNFQMAQHLYQDGPKKSKEVAYLSLDWDLYNCIPDFVSNLKNGKIPPSTIDAHRIPSTWIANVEEYKIHIQQLLESNVGYPAIAENDLSSAELEKIRKVKTNLTKIRPETAKLLARHAENMTELQVKLYCPGILKLVFDGADATGNPGA